MSVLIGVSGSHNAENRTIFIRENYMQSIIRAGGIPMLLPQTDDPQVIKEIADSIDGLLLAGGGDVDPRYYHEEQVGECDEPDPVRDGFELPLIEVCRKKHMPIFGICRGIQVLCVSEGGSLIQDIPTQVELKFEKHMQQAPYNLPIHKIRIAEDGLLQKIIGKPEMSVNSTHHQAVRRLPDGYRIDATSEEGIIEAMSCIAEPNVFAVQFHPEHFAHENPDAQALFNYFVKCVKESKGEK